MKKIAIQGSRIRGKDVMEILDLLGGINVSALDGTNPYIFYYVRMNRNIGCDYRSKVPEDYECYTLEEYEQKFLKTMEKIAIKGDSKQNQEIIQILESLGGINFHAFIGNDPNMYYYINNKNHIDCNALLFLDKMYKTYTLEEYKKIQNNMENKRNIQIDLNTAKEWYKQGGDLRKVALQAFTENELKALPKSWEEYCKINPYLTKGADTMLRSPGLIEISYPSLRREAYPGVIPSKERAEQFLILNKLLQIRDYYNQGWIPNWEDEKDKYTIWSFDNKLHSDMTTHANGLFTFHTKELRDEFFKNFKSDLELIKEFL